MGGGGSSLSRGPHLHEELDGALGDIQIAGAQIRPLVHGSGRVYEKEEDRHGPVKPCGRERWRHSLPSLASPAPFPSPRFPTGYVLPGRAGRPSACLPAHPVCARPSPLPPGRQGGWVGSSVPPAPTTAARRRCVRVRLFGSNCLYSLRDSQLLFPEPPPPAAGPCDQNAPAIGCRL